MSDNNESSVMSEQSVLDTHIMLIEDGQQRMQPLDQALHASGYPTRLFINTDEALIYLSKIDILIIPHTLAEQPKSSKFINAPTILVLANQDTHQLPPWLASIHARSV